jgi:hypothetical protein
VYVVMCLGMAWASYCICVCVCVCARARARGALHGAWLPQVGWECYTGVDDVDGEMSGTTCPMTQINNPRRLESSYTTLFPKSFVEKGAM